MEKRREMKVVQVALFCDECGEEMRSTGVMLAGHPAQYPHECKNGHVVKRGRTYPYIRYEEI